MELPEALSRIATLESEKSSLKEKLENEGFKARETKRELQAQLDTATARATELEGSVPKDGQAVLSKADAERYATYQALGKPEEVKASLEQAARDRQAVLTQGNRDALTKRGVDPEALVHPAFEGVQFATSGEGETLKTVATTSEGEKAWDDFVTEKKLTDYLKRFVLTQDAAVVPTPYTGPGKRQPTSAKRTEQEITAQKQADPTYSI